MKSALTPVLVLIAFQFTASSLTNIQNTWGEMFRVAAINISGVSSTGIKQLTYPAPSAIMV